MNTAHVASLATKHAKLEERLESERLRPLPDEIVVATLKKQKLRLKETIEATVAL